MSLINKTVLPNLHVYLPNQSSSNANALHGTQWPILIIDESCLVLNSWRIIENITANKTLSYIFLYLFQHDAYVLKSQFQNCVIYSRGEEEIWLSFCLICIWNGNSYVKIMYNLCLLSKYTRSVIQFFNFLI